MTDSSKRGRNNKRKGSNAERYYANFFRENGYPHCKTAREGSKLHDNCGIDLIFIPFNIQIKAGKQKALNVTNELKNISSKVKENFPQDSPELTRPNILIHKKEVGQGVKRTEFDEIVSMTFVDFVKLIKKD